MKSTPIGYKCWECGVVAEGEVIPGETEEAFLQRYKSSEPVRTRCARAKAVLAASGRQPPHFLGTGKATQVLTSLRGGLRQKWEFLRS